MAKEMIQKVVVIGPESTGKSSLCGQLAVHFNTRWVPEYAREYLLTHGRQYGYDDLEKIARGQLESEDAISAIARSEQESGILFVDTDMYVMKVWSEFVFNRCDNRILNQIVKRKYDLYLLCDSDLPWVKDELREYPELEQREQLFHYYKDAMVNQQVPWVTITGNYEDRFQRAVESVKQFCLKSS